MKLKHIKPCSDCAFRRNARPGWTGAANAYELVAAPLTDSSLPCHQAVDYSDPEWETTQLPDAPLCAGALAFTANIIKRPRDPELAFAVEAVGKRDDVFAMPSEFLTHHGAEPLDTTYAILGKIEPEHDDGDGCGIYSGDVQVEEIDNGTVFVSNLSAGDMIRDHEEQPYLTISDITQVGDVYHIQYEEADV